MRQLLAGSVMVMLAATGLWGQAEERIPNAHGDCAMPMRGFFRMADMDKNGAVTRPEWDKMFNLIDQNHDGMLDARELAAFEKNGMMMQHQMLLNEKPGARPSATGQP